MKKCPTCEKTFDDNLKFCQTDGTPLVAVEEEKPEDPYKTTVAKASDLPIPPFDPLKTMVASPPPAEEPKKEIKEDVANEPEEEIDMMKTMVSSDVPKFDPVLKPEKKEEPKTDAPQSTPFGNQPNEKPSDDLTGLSTALPADPPKFNEPSLNPPSFGETPPKPETPSEPVAPKQSNTGQFENNPPTSAKPNDLSGDSPYGDTDNAPIPSPFDLSMPPGYQIPSAPMPPYKEAEVEEVKAEALNTPFADEVKQGNQQIEQPQQGWNPPPSPNANWQEQQIGQNTPFQPPAAGVQGENKTLAIVALVLGILSIPCCGFLSGIPAVIVGFMAKSKAESSPQEFGGRGLALGGIITGIIGTILSVAIFILQIALGGLANMGNF